MSDKVCAQAADKLLSWCIEIGMSRVIRRLMEIVRRATVLKGMGPGGGLSLGP